MPPNGGILPKLKIYGKKCLLQLESTVLAKLKQVPKAHLFVTNYNLNFYFKITSITFAYHKKS